MAPGCRVLRRERLPAQASALLGVLALHAAFVGLMMDSSPLPRTRDLPVEPAARIALRLIPAAPVARPVTPTVAMPMPTPAPATKRARPVRSADAVRALPFATAPAAITAPARETAGDAAPEVARDAAARIEPGASTASPEPSLLDTEATRRAIRASARGPSLGEQLARSREEPERAGAQARLAEGVKAAGKGDCLKGEFAGAGMGLLSLPFLVVAGVRGDCAK